jgi:hypothetical protein
MVNATNQLMQLRCESRKQQLQKQQRATNQQVDLPGHASWAKGSEN